MQTFEPRCWKNEVIVIEKALYGRHKIGKCISEKEAAAFSQESYDFFGCYADVRDILNSKCSGRKQCEIRVPEPDLERTRTCLSGLQMFLEVSYKCLEGTLRFPLSSLLFKNITMSIIALFYSLMLKLREFWKIPSGGCFKLK